MLYDNPVAERVETPGGNADFTLTVQVEETDPEPEGGLLALPGDIGLGEVSFNSSRWARWDPNPRLPDIRSGTLPLMEESIAKC